MVPISSYCGIYEHKGFDTNKRGIKTAPPRQLQTIPAGVEMLMMNSYPMQSWWFRGLRFFCWDFYWCLTTLVRIGPSIAVLLSAIKRAVGLSFLAFTGLRI